MKYKDLIEMLSPFAEEEISMDCFNDTEVKDGRKRIVSEIRFFKKSDGEFIVGLTSDYDLETLNDVSEIGIITR